MLDVNKFVCDLAREEKKIKLISDLLVKLGVVICANTNANSFDIETSGSCRGKKMTVAFKGTLN